jgi:small subunit ribosomal protein S16
VALRIRMKMIGRKHRQFYRICVMEASRARDSNPVEEIGTYDPLVRDKSQRVKLDQSRYEYWVSVGAKPSERVASLYSKVKENRLGQAAPPPAAAAPKPLPTAAPSSSESEPAAEG